MLDDTKIRNRNHVGQVRDFSGLQFGSIYPTDIDGFIEYKNKCYVLIETKHEGAELPNGQRLALERGCDDLLRTKPTQLIVATHNTNGDIDVANTVVYEYRWNKRWHRPIKRITTKEFVTEFFNWVDGNESTRERK